MMNNRGLSTEPWWTPNCTLKTSLNELFTLSQLLVFWCFTCTRPTIHSGIRTFCKANHRTFLGILPKSLSSVLSQITEFVSSEIIFTTDIKRCFQISVTTSKGPGAFYFFILLRDFSTVAWIITGQGPKTGPASDKSSTHQGNSTLSNLP